MHYLSGIKYIHTYLSPYYNCFSLLAVDIIPNYHASYIFLEDAMGNTILRKTLGNAHDSSNAERLHYLITIIT